MISPVLYHPVDQAAFAWQLRLDGWQTFRAIVTRPWLTRQAIRLRPRQRWAWLHRGAGQRGGR